MVSRRSGVLLLVACTSLTALAQQPGTYTERVEVARVLIDARVLDDEGQPVRDLGPDDFSVKMGGKPARVESALWVTGAPSDPALLDSAELRTEYMPGQGRLIVFVFQKSLEPSRILGFMRMLIEARGLLNGFGPQDRVAVLSFESSLRIWIDFTNNFDRIRRIFQRGILFENPGAMQESVDPSLMRRLNTRRAARTYSIEEALQRIGEAIEDLPGVKSVILVGHGFGRLGPTGVVMENGYPEMVATLQAARASVFCLDVTEADYHSLEAGLQLVAEDTGGFFARTHLFPKQAINSLVGALAGHYVLFVERPLLDRGVHDIEVTLPRRKGTVYARNSYIQETHEIRETHETLPEPLPAVRAHKKVDSCGVTAATDSPVAPSPHYPASPPDGGFWHGTPVLWTMLPDDGTWASLPRGENGYAQKIFLWRPGYDGRSEQWPEVSVTGRRLDGAAGPIVAEAATNAYRRDFGGWTMRVDVEVPTAGCWELTATHRDSAVTFIVRVR
jgi:VWFA-related protein